MIGNTSTMTNKGPTPTKLVQGEQARSDELFTLDDVDPIGRTEAMLYGPPGTGKSVMAGTFPGPFRWLAADGNTSLKSLRWAMKEGKLSIKDPKDLVAYAPTEVVKGRYIDKPQAFNLMQDMITDHWFGSDVENWSTLVLDSFTEINEWALDLGLSLNKQYPKPDRPLSTSDQVNRQAMTRLVTGQQDYKSAMGLVEGFLRNVRSLCAVHGKNLVVICHEYQETSEDSNGNEIVTAIKPLLIGQLRERIVKSFDDVWHLEKFNGSKGVEIKVDLNGNAKVYGKTRWGSIFAKSQEPDFQKLMAEVKRYHGL